jgi:hypothetical protein
LRLQFPVEAAMVCLIGGLAGSAVGLAGCLPARPMNFCEAGTIAGANALNVRAERLMAQQAFE